ncbi:MAG: DNA/RNA nuclease SfsA [Lentisphaeria bacterium]|nr:DNA/RNA nuclease SfsA [Lentisphaeria bacterium]
MTFETPLLTGQLVCRRNRFVVEVRLDDGQLVEAHCTNTGSMRTCSEPGWKVALSRSDNPKRKLQYTWEIIHNGVCWIGVNTHLANRLAEEAIRDRRIPELDGYGTLQREKSYGKNSRIDLLLSNDDSLCYVEVKNVSLLADDGLYSFPDAVTERGRKHLRELTDMVHAGHRAVMLYVIQRSDGCGFRTAHEIDPAYATALADAMQKGVEAFAYRADVELVGIELRHREELLLQETEPRG